VLARTAAAPLRHAMQAFLLWVAAMGCFLAATVWVFREAGFGLAAAVGAVLMFGASFVASGVLTWLVYFAIYLVAVRFMRSLRPVRGGLVRAASEKALQWTAILFYAYALLILVGVVLLFVTTVVR
jgi:hypothetical protein